MVSALAELCKVGGKRDGVGAAVWNAVPLLGGMGLKVTPIRFTPQTWANRQNMLGALIPAG